MSNTPMKAALLGAGYISDYHLDAVNRLANVELVAICDMNEPAAKKLAGDSGIAVYSDLNKMLTEVDLDVVHILTQPDSHFPLAKMVLEAGCHALLEKPVTVSSEQAESLKAIAEQNGKRLAVNHNFVFSRPFNQLQNLLQQGSLGPIRSVRVVWRKELGQLTHGPWNLWMLREPGNILFETGSHSLSELLAVITKPEIRSVNPRLPVTLPSGSVFYRRWNITGQAGDTWIQIDTAFDQGYEQHFIEVEGMFGVARADMENDVFYTHQPTGKAYDIERLRVNTRAGVAQFKQAIGTYLSYGASKLSAKYAGNPYDASMFFGIENCYKQLNGDTERFESSIDYAISIAHAAEAIQAQMPETPDTSTDAPSLPPIASEPALNASVLLIGASGFIGKRLLAQLQAAGHKTRILVRNPSSLVGVDIGENVEVMIGDYRNQEITDKALNGIETVFHLAVAHGSSLEGYLKVDSEPTLRFVEQCQAKGIKRFVYTGTIDSLNLAKPHAIKESDGVDPMIKRRNNYAHSKAITEDKLMRLHNEEGFPVVIVRPAIVLGLGGPVSHLGVANWFGLGRCAYWGDGQNLIPTVLVDDVARGLLAAATTPGIEGRIYNLSAEPCISAQDYVAEIEQAIGCKITTTATSARKHFLGDLIKWAVKKLARHPDAKRVPSVQDWRCREQHASFDTSAAAKDLNWQPINDRETILEKGVREPARALLK